LIATFGGDHGSGASFLESCSAGKNRVESNQELARSSARLPRQVRDCPPTPAGRRACQSEQAPTGM